MKTFWVWLVIAAAIVFVTAIATWIVPITRMTSIEDQESYLACGCGCCGDVPAAQEVCLFRSRGDDMRRIILDDKDIAKSRICQYAGCSRGVLYRYCE
ncbi:MAG: hypothetical protein ABIH41_05330 [Nanoarchaeota archaeon]